MENKLVIGIIASILVGLMSWNLSETYSLSKSMVLLQEKVSQIEKKIIKPKNKKKKK